MRKLAVFKSVKITRQLKSWLLIGMILLSNALAFYSAALAGTPPTASTPVVASAAYPPNASGPPTPSVAAQPAASSNPASALTRGPSRRSYVSPDTTPDQPPSAEDTNLARNLQNTGQNTANNVGKASTNLVTQVAEQPTMTAIRDLAMTPPNNTNTGTTGGTTGGGAGPGEPLKAWRETTVTAMNSSTGIMSTFKVITDYLVSFTQTSPTRGDTGGWSAPFFNALQAMWYYTIGGGWLTKIGWIISKFIQETVAFWLAPAIGKFLMAKVLAFKDMPDVSFQTDTFSIQMRDWNHLVRDFAFDLLLLFLFFPYGAIGTMLSGAMDVCGRQ